MHLQLFNVEYKFVHLQLFDVKFLFSEKHIFGKLKKTPAVCGLASVFSDFKLTRENDDLFSSRRKYIFEVPHPVHEYTVMRIPNKSIRQTWFVLFEVLSLEVLEVLGVDHFSRYRTKIYEKQEKL